MRTGCAENPFGAVPRIPSRHFWFLFCVDLCLLWITSECCTTSAIGRSSPTTSNASCRASRWPHPAIRPATPLRAARAKTRGATNDSLTLAGIPPEVLQYRLGNRSAIEWVIDQYRVKEDKRSGIRSDPNNPDDPEYIVRLVGQVVRVSVETVKIVAALPHHYAPEPQARLAISGATD